MRIGKVKESILKRSVLRQLNREPDRDAGVGFVTNPVEGWTLAAPRAVYGAVNALAAAGLLPTALALNILMPPGTEEKQLKQFMKELGGLCALEGLAVTAGHTAVSSSVNTLLLSVTGMGTTGRKAESVSDESRDKKLDVVMTGHAGREGAALQIGGGIGCRVGTLFKLDEKAMRLITLCGMSALFTALFVLSFTATIFALEVISVGVLYYSGFVPCILGSVTALAITTLLGAEREKYAIGTLGLDMPTTIRVVALGIMCALVSIVFCEAMHHVEKRLRLSVKKPVIRGLVGGAILIGMTLIFGTSFNGTGENVISAAIAGEHIAGASFFIKILFTAVSRGCGFKGGEIVPSFFIGACFGSAFGSLIGLPPGAAAALGLVAMFCGAFNCPLAAIMLSIEMFGSDNLIYFALICGISYMLSGYFGIYRSQRIVYSKLKAEFINRYTR